MIKKIRLIGFIAIALAFVMNIVLMPKKVSAQTNTSVNSECVVSVQTQFGTQLASSTVQNCGTCVWYTVEFDEHGNAFYQEHSSNAVVSLNQCVYKGGSGTCQQQYVSSVNCPEGVDTSKPLPNTDTDTDTDTLY